MIKFTNASLSFGSTIALQNCSLEIKSGEQLALIGPSGSGKSSLMKTITTENLLNSGSLVLDSFNMASVNSAELKLIRRSIAYIPQDLALVPNIKVSQNVSLGGVGDESTLTTLKNLTFPSRNYLNKIHSILNEVGITDKIFHRTDSLSGGQQQRVAIARAIFQNATYLLADEPVSAVDPTRAHSILELLTKIATDHGLTLICTLHNLDYAKKFFPRLIGMRSGAVFYDGSAMDFTAQDFNELYSLDYSQRKSLTVSI
jgi:phosphonate transport system ATP-binding protein